MEPPFVVYRDRTSEGVEVITSVPWEDNEKMRALARQMIAAAFQGGAQSAQANQAVEGVFASALGPDADRRGYAVVMAYHLRTALAEMQAARSQQFGQQPAPQPMPPPQQPAQAPSYYPQQPQQQAPNQQVGAPQPQPQSGGGWGIPAPPVGGGAPNQVGGVGGGAPGMAPTQVPGVRAYSRSPVGGAPSRAAGGGGAGSGVTAGAQNVKRQAGGFKTYNRPGPPRAPHVATPSGDSPWAAAQAATAAALQNRSVGPNGSPTIVTTSDGGGEE